MILKLVEKRKEAKDTLSFFWKAKKAISWLPGQFFYFTLPNMKKKDPKGPTRHFTISSSTTESQIIRITTRIRTNSFYKQELSHLSVSDVIEAEGPNGTFILDENEPGKHVLLAGGIGITPFRSFIKYVIDKELKETELYLIYSNSTPQEITFRKELEDWSKKFENIKVAMTISQSDKSGKDWTGLTGRINTEMIKTLLDNWKLNVKNLNFWLCGPPQMVEDLENALGKMKITSDQLRSEKFTGY